MIKIAPYVSGYQNDIDALMVEIAGEYALPFSHPGAEFKLPEKYWIVLNETTVVGTIGINVKGQYATLKRMFLKKEFRGEDKGFSTLLLKTAISYCLEKALKQLYLGTMEQFKAAQTFYLKNGFIRVDLVIYQ